MREISMRSRPFTGNQDGNFGGRRSYAGKIQLACNLRKLLELGSQGLILTVPGRHSPTRLLRGAQVWRLVKLLRRRVGIAPEIYANRSRSQTGIYLQAIVNGNSLG